MQTLPKLVLAFGAVEAVDVFTRRRWDRRKLYDAAQTRAKMLDRPLVVVGAPNAGVATRLAPIYDCGDICIDLQGCKKCGAPPRDVTDLSDLADDSAVVFVSCVLEYVTDPAAAVQELQRVAGSNLFVVRVPPWSIVHLTYGPSRQRLLSVPKGTGTPIRWAKVPWRY